MQTKLYNTEVCRHLCRHTSDSFCHQKPILRFGSKGIEETDSSNLKKWAKLDGQDLPEKVISPYLGVQYSRLSDGPEKDAKLKLILQQCYEDALFKHEGQKLSQSVRIA